MRLLGVVLVAALLVAAGIAVTRASPRGRAALSVPGPGGGDRVGAGAAFGLVLFGVVTLPLSFGYGLRSGAGVLLAVLPSLLAIGGGAAWLRLLRRGPRARPGPPRGRRPRRPRRPGRRTGTAGRTRRAEAPTDRDASADD